MDARTGCAGAPMRPANSDRFGKSKDVASGILTGFAESTLILTNQGPKAVQDIRAGMRVHTRDHGLREVLWSGRTDRKATRELQPIVVPQGALGNDITLKVAANQGLLFTEWRALMFFGEPEVLVEAKGLLGMSGIHRRQGVQTRFFQIMLDQHTLIQTNGAWTESLHADDVSPATFGADAARDVFEAAPVNSAAEQKVVPALSTAEARLLQAA